MNLTISLNRRKAEYVLNPVLRGYAESVAGVILLAQRSNQPCEWDF
jgi:hypothetical protein